MTILTYWAYQPQTKTVSAQTAALPAVGEGEVLVKNHAIGINPVDWKLINTNLVAWSENHIPGVDGAGEIVAVAEDKDRHLIGKRVAYHAFLQQNGSFASHSVVNKDRVMILPDSLSYQVAASLPCPMLTAYQAIEKIPVKVNADVLIAGFGAVTKILIQLLVAAGFNVDVISSHLSETQAHRFGIRQLYRNNSQIEQHYFAAFDTIGELSAIRLVKQLKANGHIICILQRIEKPVDPAFTRTISYHEIALGALHQFGDKADWQALMSQGEMLMNQIAHGELIVEKPDEFNFLALPQALLHSETTRQKTVVTV